MGEWIELKAADGVAISAWLASPAARPRGAVVVVQEDHHIPMAGVREVEAAHPETPVYVYPAGHGFNCDERGSYDAPSAALAWSRTLHIFGKTLR